MKPAALAKVCSKKIKYVYMELSRNTGQGRRVVSCPRVFWQFCISIEFYHLFSLDTCQESFLVMYMWVFFSSFFDIGLFIDIDFDFLQYKPVLSVISCEYSHTCITCVIFLNDNEYRHGWKALRADDETIISKPLSQLVHEHFATLCNRVFF